MTLERITRIIQKWKELEELSIGPIKHNCSDRFFRTVGNSCKNLTRLHIFGSFSLEVKSSCDYVILDENNASIIAENLPKLRVFSIDEANVHKSGVWTLLSESKNLVELSLKQCCGIVDPPISAIIGMLKMKYLENDITVEIIRSCCRVKNCLKKWSIASSAAEDHMISYTTQELVNQLWTGDVVEIEL